MNTKRNQPHQEYPTTRQLKHVIAISFALGCLAFTSGCSTMSGVGRTVKVPQLPSAAVVEASLRDVPNVSQITHYPPNAGHAEKFSYRSGELSSVIELARENTGQNTLYLYSYWKHHIPSQQVLDETRALMDAVYASLRQHAPDLPAATEVKEVLVRPPKR